MLLWGTAAFAATYEVEIDVDSEQDLYELYTKGEISEETLHTLVELMRDGVNLDRASREELYELPGLGYAEVDAILHYRKLSRSIDDPAKLVGAGALTPEQLQKIAAFLVIEAPQGALPMGGRLRALSAYSLADPNAPPAFLQAKLKAPFDLTGSVLLLTERDRLGPVQYDPVRGALSATAPAYSLRVPKFFVQWKRPQRQAVAGTFRIGFGQRLTLDNTTRQAPNGIYGDDVVFLGSDLSSKDCTLAAGELSASPCSAEEQNRYVLSDFSVREGFRGLAGGIDELEVGSGKLSAYAFGSYQSRSVYQYELYAPNRCVDPHDDADPACASPQVFVRQDDPFAPTARFAYQTLPEVWTELAAGGHLALSLGPARVGATAYGALPSWNVAGASLDFQEWSRYPYGGPFGAAGLDAAISFGALNFFAEATRSFDSMGGAGGGVGLLQRSVLSLKRQELELSLRYYDRNFVNPYGRPISGPDELEGQRARNELGARLSYEAKRLWDLRLRAAVDLWAWPQDGEAQGTAGRTSLYAYARADFEGFRSVVPGLWVDLRNKDLGQNDRGECYETSTERNESGEPLPCSGELRRVAARVQFEPWGKLFGWSVQGQYSWLDDPVYANGFRQDAALWVEAFSRPSPAWRLNARVRYLTEDLVDPARLEDSVWGVLDATYIYGPQLLARLRYDLLKYLDQRASTALRQPQPEQRIRLELEARF